MSNSLIPFSFCIVTDFHRLHNTVKSSTIRVNKACYYVYMSSAKSNLLSIDTEKMCL